MDSKSRLERGWLSANVICAVIKYVARVHPQTKQSHHVCKTVHYSRMNPDSVNGHGTYVIKLREQQCYIKASQRFPKQAVNQS
jgi:hypothetical protein